MWGNRDGCETVDTVQDYFNRRPGNVVRTAKNCTSIKALFIYNNKYSSRISRENNNLSKLLLKKTIEQ